MTTNLHEKDRVRRLAKLCICSASTARTGNTVKKATLCARHIDIK